MVVGAWNRRHAKIGSFLWLLGSFCTYTAAAAAGVSVNGSASSSTDNHDDDDHDDENDWLLHALQKDAHPLWLRERCLSSFYADSETRQPKYNLHEEIEDLKVVGISQVRKSGQPGFLVEFSDQHSCFYAKHLLAAEWKNERTFLQAPTWNLLPLFLWDRERLVAPPAFDYNDIVQQQQQATDDKSTTSTTMNGYTDQTRKFLSVLISTGLVLMENVPRQEGECVRFGTQFSSLRETEWGPQFNVRSTPDDGSGGVVRKDLAYTSNSIGMHVDSPYRIDTPPAYQLLHAIDHCDSNSPDGCFVHNHFVDGFFVARDLCRSNREYFDVLTKIPLRWENNGGDDSSLLYRYAPMIELEHDMAVDVGGCPPVKAINFSAKSGGYAPRISNNKDELELFYQAKRRFSSMLHDDKYTVRLQLFPGALIIFDNRRILHSRSEIAPTDGERWLQGCYLNRDGIHYLHEQLRRHYTQQQTETPFTTLKNAAKADYDRMGVEYDEAIVQKTLDNLLKLLQSQKDAYLGAPVSLLEHGLQTASRALRQGENDETVVISLFHDVFETLAVKNHGELIAAMLAPWISPKSQWLLAHHEIFQGYYYFEHYGGDPNLRDIFLTNPHYNWTVTWCELYDQASFDPDYPSLPLSTFVPIVERVLAKPQYWWNPSHPKAGAVSASVSSSSTNTDAETDGTTQPLSSDGSIGPCHDTWTCYGEEAQ